MVFPELLKNALDPLVAEVAGCRIIGALMVCVVFVAVKPLAKLIPELLELLFDSKRAFPPFAPLLPMVNEPVLEPVKMSDLMLRFASMVTVVLVLLLKVALSVLVVPLVAPGGAIAAPQLVAVAQAPLVVPVQVSEAA